MRIRLPLVWAALAAVATVGCGASPSGTPKTAASSAAPTPTASTPVTSPATSASPSPPPSPDQAEAIQVALHLYSGGGSAQTGLRDCLTYVATCPVTDRLRARFSVFPDARQTSNAGGGSNDPICRGCQGPYSDVKVASVSMSPGGATVFVDLYTGPQFQPLAVVEVPSGTGLAVDDVLCVRGGKADPTSSLYLVTVPICFQPDAG